MRQADERRAERAFQAEQLRRELALRRIEPEPEGITPEQMELIRDTRTKYYWIYSTRNMKELEVVHNPMFFHNNLDLKLFDYPSKRHDWIPDFSLNTNYTGKRKI